MGIKKHKETYVSKLKSDLKDLSVLNEIGGSLGDYIDNVRNAFYDSTNGYEYYVRDVFRDHVIVCQGDQCYSVSMSQSGNTFKFGEQSTWKKVKIDYVQEMVSINIVTELGKDQSTLPNIDVRNGVDLQSLTNGDENPFFITLEVANKDAVSQNKLIYDQNLMDMITEQINNQPIEGIMGHLKSTERSSAFPVADIHWLGATQQDNKVFAKGYIPKTNPSTREHFRILQATGGKAATSIYGWADQTIVDSKLGTWKADTFILEQLDLAPSTRAALAPSTKHMITSELVNNKENNKMEVNISEMELKELKDKLKEYEVKEYQVKVGQLVKETFNWEVTTDKGKEALNVLRQFVAEYASTVGENENDIKRIVSEVAADLKPLTELLVSALSGPTSFVSEKKLGIKSAFEDTPEKRREARAKWGLVE